MIQIRADIITLNQIRRLFSRRHIYHVDHGDSLTRVEMSLADLTDLFKLYDIKGLVTITAVIWEE